MFFKVMKMKSKSCFVPGRVLDTGSEKAIIQPMAQKGIFFDNLWGSSWDHFHWQEVTLFMKNQNK